jgi:ribokinase
LPPDLTVVGSINLDLVARVDRLPRPGETVGGAELARVPGGKGANQAVAAARLGARVRMVGCVGADPLAAEALAGLEAAGVHLEVEHLQSAPTGVALIFVDAQGENVIVVVPGANGEVDPKHALGAVLCQLEIPLEAVQAAAAQADYFALNAAPARKLPAALIDRADVLVVNRYELDAIGRKSQHLTAVTLGAEGAVLYRGEDEIARAAPPPITAVDGTAAGDAFCACLVVGLLEERDPEDALRRACAAGAIAASRFGAQPSLPTGAEVEEILRTS